MQLMINTIDSETLFQSFVSDFYTKQIGIGDTAHTRNFRWEGGIRIEVNCIISTD